MLIKLLSSILFFYKYLTTPRDYSIISEEIEYAVDHDMKYHIEDDFWLNESKDWEDEILDEYYLNVTGKKFIKKKENAEIPDTCECRFVC